MKVTRLIQIQGSERIAKEPRPEFATSFAQKQKMKWINDLYVRFDFLVKYSTFNFLYEI